MENPLAAVTKACKIFSCLLYVPVILFSISIAWKKRPAYLEFFSWSFSNMSKTSLRLSSSASDEM